MGMKYIFTAVLLLILAAPASGQDFKMRALATLERGGIKFYEQADELAGISSCLKATLSKFEIIGYFIEARKTVWIRQQFETFLWVVPAVLAFGLDGERYDDGGNRGTVRAYSEALPRGGCFKSPRALKDDLIGLDNFLAIYEASNRDLLEQEELVSGDESYRHHLKDRVNAIQLVRSVIGAPPLITNVEELDEAIKEFGLVDGDLVNFNGTVMEIDWPELGEAPEGDQ